jgi:hypothetical protein
MGNALDLPLLSGSVLFIALVPALLLGLAIPYAVLALRDSREVERDPQVGWKAALYFIFSLCLLQVLTGLTVFIYDLLDGAPAPLIAPAPPPQPWQQFPNQVQPPFRTGPAVRPPWSPTASQRTAVGLAFAGFVLGGFHLFLIHMASNAQRFPAARRVFLGARLAVHSLIVMGAFTVLIILMMDLEGVRWESLKPVVVTLVVWGPSWMIHLILLSNASRKAPRQLGQLSARPLPVE